MYSVFDSFIDSPSDIVNRLFRWAHATCDAWRWAQYGRRCEYTYKYMCCKYDICFSISQIDECAATSRSVAGVDIDVDIHTYIHMYERCPLRFLSHYFFIFFIWFLSLWPLRHSGLLFVGVVVVCSKNQINFFHHLALRCIRTSRPNRISMESVCELCGRTRHCADRAHIVSWWDEYEKVFALRPLIIKLHSLFCLFIRLLLLLILQHTILRWYYFCSISRRNIETNGAECVQGARWWTCTARLIAHKITSMWGGGGSEGGWESQRKQLQENWWTTGRRGEREVWK